MGLEKVVLSAIENVDGGVADNAEFFNGTLFLSGAARVETHIGGIRLSRVVDAIKSVVSCTLEVHEAGDDIVIDFV